MMFPVTAMALSVVVNGTTLRSYRPAFLRSGRVVAPVEPFLTTVTAGIESSGKVLIVRWRDRFAQVPMPRAAVPTDFASVFVEIGPILRTLGISVSYDSARRTLYVQTPKIPLTTPTPFNAAVPYATPRVVFTPSPEPTPVPKITGTPLPRRTPLPVETSIPIHAFHMHPKFVLAPRSQKALQLYVVNRFKRNGMNRLSCNDREHVFIALPNHQLARVEECLSKIRGIGKRSQALNDHRKEHIDEIIWRGIPELINNIIYLRRKRGQRLFKTSGNLFALNHALPFQPTAHFSHKGQLLGLYAARSTSNVVDMGQREKEPVHFPL